MPLINNMVKARLVKKAKGITRPPSAAGQRGALSVMPCHKSVGSQTITFRDARSIR